MIWGQFSTEQEMLGFISSVMGATEYVVSKSAW